MKYKYVFGPVPSRRLGVSLGVDLVRHKICTMNCIYCECGETTNLTLDRMEYVPLNDIKEELKSFLDHNPDPDYITFSGSGEPTLNPCMGDFIDYIRTIRPNVRIAAITNSSLISLPDVKKALLKTDVILPSLDAVTQKVFQKINRPHPGLKAENIAKAIEEFSREFTGKIWLEVFVVPGVNDELSDIIALKEAIHRIRPDQLQLNTLDRPGTISTIIPASKEEMKWIAQIIDYPDTEIIARVSNNKPESFCQNDLEAAIIETIKRRPCTKTDLLNIFGNKEKILEDCLNTLINEGRIAARSGERGLFYNLSNTEKNEIKETGQ